MSHSTVIRLVLSLSLPTAVAIGQGTTVTASALANCREASQELQAQQAAPSPEVSKLLQLARLALQCHQPQQALLGYQRVLQLDRKSVAGEIGMGQTDNFLRQYGEARKHLQLALSLSPQNADAEWALARTEIYQHQPQRAVRILNRGVREHPSDYRLWESLGEAELLRGKQSQAASALRTALRLNPRATRAQQLLDTLQQHAPRGPNPMGPRVEFHDSAFLLHDALGNNVFSSPQELRFRAGRWRDRLRGEYQRAAFAGREGGYWGAGTSLLALDNESSLRISDQLTIAGGAGEAHLLGSGGNRPLFNFGVDVTPWHGLQIVAAYRQQMFTPTARAMALMLSRRGWNTGLNFEHGDSRVHLDYAQARIRDGNQTRGGRGEFARRVWKGPFDVWAGYRWEGFSFTRPSLAHGYFAPRRFRANTGVLQAQGDRGRWHFDWELGIGEESYQAQSANAAGLVAILPDHRSPRVLFIGRNSFRLTPNFSLNASLLSFRTTLGSGTGSYRAQGVLIGLTRKF